MSGDSLEKTDVCCMAERRDGVREGCSGVTTSTVTASLAKLRRDGVFCVINASFISSNTSGVTALLIVCAFIDLSDGV